MDQAAKWYRKAADQGDVLAQKYLGTCYRSGDGVFKNEIEAFAYWSLAGVVDEWARAQVALLEQSLTPVDLMRAHQRTNELRKELEQKAEERLALLDGN
jgi:TPR repeat protein